MSTLLSKRADVPLPWRLRVRMARDAMDGLVALHETDAIHRDVKTENFLVDDAWRVVVADYGFARKARNDVAMTICGTDEFMAPEVIFGEVYDEKADVFSFGVFLCELVCRKVPGADRFLSREPRTKFKLNLDEFRAAAPADAPPSLIELAAQCCVYEAEYRMTSEVRRQAARQRRRATRRRRRATRQCPPCRRRRPCHPPPRSPASTGPHRRTPWNGSTRLPRSSTPPRPATRRPCRRRPAKCANAPQPPPTLGLRRSRPPTPPAARVPAPERCHDECVRAGAVCGLVLAWCLRLKARIKGGSGQHTEDDKERR